MSAQPDRDALHFLPLGGAGEIGMNLNLYGYAGKWLMLDLGITFSDDTTPGIDILVPDPAWIADRRKDLVGLVLTHAHEDHLGAVAYLWDQLRCPIWATPFAASVLRRKLEEWDLVDEVKVHIYNAGDRWTIGPFDLEAIPLTHSIPEMQSIAIRTPVGMVLHTGDFKLDSDPLVGPVSDEAALRRLGDEGILALVCDSTNVFNEGESGSEGAVRESLLKLCAGRKGRIAITTFASNVARIATAAEVARQTGREIALIGRSLLKMAESAKEAGYLKDSPKFLTEYDIGYIPQDKVLLLCTGCQGEPRGAMARIANGDHPNVSLGRGDVVIFSARIIPGNERKIATMQNRLIEDGIELITERDAFVHVSGHPARDELARIYALTRPRIAVPVHGEARHIAEHARYAKSLQVPQSVAVGNGQMLRLAPGKPQIVATVPSGRLAVDQGNGDLLLLQGPVLQARRRLMNNGVVMLSLGLDGKCDLVADPNVTILGVADGEADDLAEEVAEAVAQAVERLNDKAARDDDAVTEAARRAARRVVKDWCGRRPPVEVHVMRLGEERARAPQPQQRKKKVA